MNIHLYKIQFMYLNFTENNSQKRSLQTTVYIIIFYKQQEIKM